MPVLLSSPHNCAVLRHTSTQGNTEENGNANYQLICMVSQHTACSKQAAHSVRAIGKLEAAERGTQYPPSAGGLRFIRFPIDVAAR